MSNIERFADDLLRDMLVLAPELAAELGVTAVTGRVIPLDGVPDFSDEACANRRLMMRQAARTLKAIDIEALGRSELITWRVLRYLLEDGLFGPFAGQQGHAFAEIPYPMNHLSGWHPTLVMMLTRDRALRETADVEAYLEQLRKVPDAASGALDAMRARERDGISPPRASLRKAIAGIEAFLESPPQDNMLVGSLREKLTGFDRLSVSTWVDTAERIVEGSIRPAYARLLDAMRAQLPGASDQGVWSHPHGCAYYAWALHGHTTLECSPEEVHRLGLSEIQRVGGAIRAEFARLGSAGASIADLYAQISGPAYRAFPAGTTRQSAKLRVAQLIEELEHRSRHFFRLRPGASIEVEMIAAEFENSQHTRYTPPVPGGMRPGRLSVNLNSLSAQAVWELPVMCAHEAVPGHHLQLALAQELPLCAFRRAVVFTAYIEGWAKYAETLLDHALMDDPLTRLGRLRAELYSSVNLALDTGIHALRWTRAQACRFFCEHTGADAAFSEQVVDRSLVAPGELCAYKIGMLKICELRDRFERARSARFELCDFHDAVLDEGALPLGVLEQHVQEVIANGP
jgi:uncharacterized protein (DUF885 family)